MTSICSSPPNAFYHNSVTTPPPTSKKSFTHLQNGLITPGFKALQKSPSLTMPRGHDSSDIAALSKSLEEQAVMPTQIANVTDGKHISKTSNHATAEAHTQAESKELSCKTDEGEPQGPFEGPEKLLELWFGDSKDDVVGQGLKAVEKRVWEEMLDIVKCKVLSTIQGSDVDAYLLSESSMFVFPHKLILKTCGTTTLLLGLERILKIAHSVIPSVSNEHPSSVELGKIVKQCFYSRKSFMFPERQKGPHRDWMLEVGLLDRFFERGSAYTVGKMNGDHWLLYMTSPSELDQVEPSAGQVERPLRLPNLGRPKSLSDQTLEILMTFLSPTSCARFEFPSDIVVSSNDCIPEDAVKDRGHVLGSSLSNQLGLNVLFPNTTLDAFAFEPCGFSANAVVRGNGKTIEDGYWTVHVTPEQDSSYASFETNVHMDETGGSDKKDLPWLITRVLSIFEPGRLSVTLFTSSDAQEEDETSIQSNASKGQDQGDVLHSLQLKNYKRTDRIAYEFEDYDLVFISFDKQDMRLPRR